MKRPSKRPEIPPRTSNNEKRKLDPSPNPNNLATLASRILYVGISKHKLEPLKFGLDPYQGQRGDETMCDRDANFQPQEMPQTSAILARGVKAGLISVRTRQGVPALVWGISDIGWIFEARITNATTAEYHGYPVRPSEPIAEIVYGRFAGWAEAHGGHNDRLAASNCRALYGFRQ